MKIDARFQKMFTDKRFHTKCIYYCSFFFLWAFQGKTFENCCLRKVWQSLEFDIYTSWYCSQRYMIKFLALKDIFFSSYLWEYEQTSLWYCLENNCTLHFCKTCLCLMKRSFKRYFSILHKFKQILLKILSMTW